jgi:hypothetical protein
VTLDKEREIPTRSSSKQACTEVRFHTNARFVIARTGCDEEHDHKAFTHATNMPVYFVIRKARGSVARTRIQTACSVKAGALPIGATGPMRNVGSHCWIRTSISRLSVEYSSQVELSGLGCWSRWRDSNARPLRPERSTPARLSYIENEIGALGQIRPDVELALTGFAVQRLQPRCNRSAS